MNIMKIRSLVAYAPKNGHETVSMISQAARHINTGPENNNKVQQDMASTADRLQVARKSYLLNLTKSAPFRVYRGEKRHPLYVFDLGCDSRHQPEKEKLIVADLENHALRPHLAIENKKSCFVSTSTRKIVATRFATKSVLGQAPSFMNGERGISPPQAYVFKIASEGQQALDVKEIFREVLGEDHPYANEEEFAFLGKIPPHLIIKAKNPITKEIFHNPKCTIPDDDRSSSDEEYDESKDF